MRVNDVSRGTRMMSRITAIGGVPDLPEIGHWRNGTAVLIDAVESYLADKNMNTVELATFRGYLRDWMQGHRPGLEIAHLRTGIGHLRTPEAITKWLARAKRSGLDPL
jgi:hypothetical protein